MEFNIQKLSTKQYQISKNLIDGLVVRCAQPPVLISQNGPLREMNGPDCTSDMHCVTDMHHMKALDAFGRVLHHGYGERGCHFVFFIFAVLAAYPHSNEFFGPGFGRLS